MGQPSLDVTLVCVYAVVLLVIAVAFDRLGVRSAQRSASWRTGNFLYHDDADAWKCHEDQWLWPASFDPEKRVVRYVGQHAICGRCPAKAECSPTPGPRELTRQVDPWPHSEAGRFHRGVSLAVAAVALMMVLVTLFFSPRTPSDVVLLLAALALVLAVGIPLARHLWNTPDGFPEHLNLDHGEDLTPSTPTAPGAPVALGMPVTLSPSQIDAALARHRSGSSSDRKTARYTSTTQSATTPSRYASDRRPS
ncbi:MAG: hypothetical protein Q4P32_10225 [Micrococcales bacterium]|nr:hypothetical protein [Micrococcales bacterium]